MYLIGAELIKYLDFIKPRFRYSSLQEATLEVHEKLNDFTAKRLNTCIKQKNTDN
jgi:phage terminase large subunit-like protein